MSSKDPHENMKQRNIILSKMNKLENDLQIYLGQNLKYESGIEKSSKYRAGTEYFGRSIQITSPKKSLIFTNKETYIKRI